MKKSRDVLCDSSSLISLGDSCLDNVLYFLHKRFGIRFVIPPEVEYEVITRPLSNGLFQYYFSSLKMKKALKDKVLVKAAKSERPLTQKILETANHLFFMKGRPLRLIHAGEAGMIALAQELGVSTILIDERTTRMLIENPISLKKHLEKEFSVHIMVNKRNLDRFSELTEDMSVIRSSELLILAYENGFLEGFTNRKKALEAGLYKIKFSGCSVGFKEIKEFLKLV